jgi:hypothetical protein
MSSEEKGNWVYLVVVIGTYGAYLAIILGRLADTPVSEVRYVSALLWSIGASIAASIVGRIVVEIVAEARTPGEGHQTDVRDKEIDRFGELAGRWFLIAGAVAALLMAMAEWDYFWIANVIYLGFALSAIGSSVLKLVAYRRGM